MNLCSDEEETMRSDESAPAREVDKPQRHRRRVFRPRFQGPAPDEESEGSAACFHAAHF